jgi:phosphatidylinositol glycan class V
MPPTLTRSTILKWALTSRILTVAWCVVSDLVLPDHAATDVERWQADQDAVLPAWLTRPFSRWDAAHLLRVARFGYVTDRDAAFFPLYPCFVHCVTKLLPFLAEAERYVVAGTFVSNACFVLAVLFAYDASLRFRPALADKTALALCATPASVFCSVPYSESLAAFLGFGGVALLGRNRPWLASVLFAAVASTRSNGCLLALVVLADGLSRSIPKRGRPLQLLGTSMRSALIILPPVAKDLWHFHKTGEARSAFAHAQSSGWGVGLLSYWRREQVPNFILAAPALGLATIACRDAFVRRPPIKRLVADLRAGDDGARLSVIELALAAHAAATAGLCLFVAHVEIATRLLACGCLPFSWALASVGDRSLWRWFVLLFVVVGPAAHCNFLPWT